MLVGKVSSSQQPLDAQAIIMIMRGLQHMSSDVVEVQDLVRVVALKISDNEKAESVLKLGMVRQEN